MRRTLSSVAMIVASLGFAGFAHAQGSEARAWVSGRGADRAACGSEETPCRTLQFAHDAIVRSGGAIFVRDAANVGPLTIRMAVSVIGTGASVVLADKGVAIDVRAGATDEVLLKGLVIEGAGTGSVGVAVESVGHLAISEVTIRGFTDATGGYGVGVLVEPQSGSTAVSIARATFADNRWVHVLVNPNRTGGTGASATATVDDVKMSGADYGVIVETAATASSAYATIENVAMTNPNHTGVYSFAYAPSAPASALVRGVTVTAARVAYAAGGFGKLSIVDSAAFASRGFDLFDLGGGVTSYGGNVLPNSGTVATAPQN